MRRRLGRSHFSCWFAPSQGRPPLQNPRAFTPAPSAIDRWAPQSHITHTCDRSPLVPRSSIQSCRIQSLRPPCTNCFQSRSATWPRGQARTNRTGTTESGFRESASRYRPFSSVAANTSRRRRNRDFPCSNSCTMYQLGNSHAVTSVRISLGCSGAGGGVRSVTVSRSRNARSFSTSRGSSITGILEVSYRQ